MEEEIKLNHTEKRHYFIYLVIMFVVITGILMALIFRKSPNPFSTASYSDVSFINQEQFFLEKQKEAVPLYDSVLVKIEGLQNVPTNLVLEIDIKNQINTLNSYYENLSNRDPRFIGFKQMAVFEKMHFEDMLVMKKRWKILSFFNLSLTNVRSVTKIKKPD